jgi:hypothetical protein
MNQPGVYLLHLAVLQTLGAGDLAWRAFDLAWLALAGLSIAAFAAPWGVVAAAGGALAFGAVHLAGGAWQAGQRDYLLCPLLVAGALGVARWLEARGGLGRLAFSGAALGAAITLKPHAGLLAVALGVVVVAAAARAGGPAAAVPAALTYGAAAAAAPAVILAWLTAAGGLGAWRQTVFEYLLPLYARLGRDAGWALHRGEAWIALTLATALSVAAVVRARRFGPRHAVALGGVAYGVVHFVGQGKGWEYHLHPLAAFLAPLLFAGLEPVAAAGRALRAALAAALVAALGLIAVKGIEAAPAAWERDKAARVTRLVEELRPQLQAGDTVQVLDTSDGGVHALLRLGRQQPTRFVYDFHFYHDVDTPVVRALRAELIGGLDAAPPRFIIVFEHGWPAGSYDRLRAFPELGERLATRYVLAAARDGYRIHAKSDRP